MKKLSGLTPGGSCRSGFASGRNKVNAPAAGAIPRDNHDGLLPKLPGDLAGSRLGTGEVPATRLTGRDNLDNKSRLAGSLPDATGAKSSHAGEALADLPVDHALHLVPRDKLTGSAGNSGADVEPGGTNGRERTKPGHLVSLSQARKKLEKRAGKDSRVYWILIDASSGEIEIETSWLPEGLLTLLNWKRNLKTGHYTMRCKPVLLTEVLHSIGAVLREEIR